MINFTALPLENNPLLTTNASISYTPELKRYTPPMYYTGRTNRSAEFGNRLVVTPALGRDVAPRTTFHIPVSSSSSSSSLHLLFILFSSPSFYPLRPRNFFLSAHHHLPFSADFQTMTVSRATPLSSPLHKEESFASFPTKLSPSLKVR